MGQSPSTFPALPSPDISSSWGSRSGLNLNEIRDPTMDDILEGYEDDSDEENDEEDQSSPPLSPSKSALPAPVPVPVPVSVAGFTPVRSSSHQRSRSIKRPQPSSLHIGSPGKRGLPSPGNFEIPDIVLLENSSKRFTSCLRSLLASLKANEKEKYASEAEVCSSFFFLFLSFNFFSPLISCSSVLLCPL